MTVALAMLVLGPLGAGDAPIPARFLEPGAHRGQAGAALELRVTGDGSVRPWRDQRVDWMFIRNSASQRNMDEPPVDARGKAQITLEQAGTGVVGIDFTPTSGSLELADLRSFIAERGFTTQTLPEGEGSLRVRRVESAKTVIVSGEPQAAAGESEATSKTGQQVEIRPLMDPAATPVGGDVALRAYVSGAFTPTARLIATHVPSGQRADVRCDSMGIGTLTISAAGAWRIELHQLRRGDDKDPWVLYSGTLTFEMPPEPELPKQEVRP